MDSTQLDSFQRWREARQQLDHALLYFHKTTHALDIALSIQTINPELFEKATMEADQDSCTMAVRIDDLKTLHITLNKIRNRSTSLVPINKLPQEVLLQVFQFSVPEHHGSPYNYYQSSQLHQATNMTLFALGRVCTRWRSLVTTTTSFWSKIYLKCDNTTDFLTTFGRVRAYLDRAHDQPLEVELRGGGSISRREIGMINTHLRQHLKYVKILRLIDFQSSDILFELMKSLLKHGQPGSVRSLTLWCKEEPTSSGRIQLTNTGLTRQRIDSFLLPIQSLFLGRVYFDWDSLVYHNLVKLQLTGLKQEKSPTIRQILGILSVSPELETLYLQNSHILAGGEASLEPVVLNKLMHLDLLGVNPEGLSSLLPMIVSSSQELSTRIDLYSSGSNTGRTVRSFLSCAKVTRLYIPRPKDPDGIARYLSAVPNLNVLILDLNSRPGDNILTSITHNIPSSSQHMPICPNLCTLYLINGSLQNETVQAVVEAHPLLKKLRFMSCFLEPFDEELLYWLKPFVKDVKCTTSLGNAWAYWYRDLT